MPLRPDTGGRKKFLYNNSIKSKNDQSEEDQWSFGPKASTTTNTPRTGLPVDLDNVWSIRNVSLGTKSLVSEPSSVRSEVLNRNAGTAYYSRHGGMKNGTRSPNSGSTTNETSGTGTNWSSSGYNFSQGSRLNNQPTSFQGPSERQFRDSRQRFQNPSPFDHDVNDF